MYKLYTQKGFLYFFLNIASVWGRNVLQKRYLRASFLRAGKKPLQKRLTVQDTEGYISIKDTGSHKNWYSPWVMLSGLFV